MCVMGNQIFKDEFFDFLDKLLLPLLNKSFAIYVLNM